MANVIRDNPEWLAEACQRYGERMAAMQWSLAEAWLKKGRPAEALEALEKVHRFAPASPLAKQAQSKIAELKGTPGFPAGFQKR
jgi:tetratricopeptide (TPR) repeat protein